MDPAPIRVIRVIWPTLSTCPWCGSQDYEHSGHRGLLRYRACAGCGRRYKVMAAAQEVDRGAGQSEIVPI